MRRSHRLRKAPDVRGRITAIPQPLPVRLVLSPARPLHNRDMLLVFPTGRYGTARVKLCVRASLSSRKLHNMPPSTSSTTAYQAKILADFVKAKLETARRRPMMVSMQGPQGAGKSTLASALVDLLAADKIRCTVSSLDGECGRCDAR